MAWGDERWGDYVARHPRATAFHHPAWAGLIASCYGFEGFSVGVTDGLGGLGALVPMVEIKLLGSTRRWVSLPFTDTCAPLVSGDCTQRLIIDELDMCRNEGVASIELRTALNEGEIVFAARQGVSHTLPLVPDAAAVYRTFKKTQVQQPITKGEREGVIIRRAECSDEMHVFYRLHAMTRRRHGTPVQPRRFFDLLWRRIVEPGLGFLLIAEKDRVPIASAFFLAWNGTIIYKFSASDPAGLGLRPNNLLLWSAIKWGCENGYRTFDFGRTDLEDEGLRAFKNGWGTREEPLFYSFIADRPPRISSGRLLRLMRPFIQKSPPIVCRILGELFYKYAA